MYAAVINGVSLSLFPAAGAAVPIQGKVLRVATAKIMQNSFRTFEEGLVAPIRVRLVLWKSTAPEKRGRHGEG